MDVEKALSKFKPTKKYLEGIGKEEWLFKNILVRQHVLTVIAFPGGGKTAIFFRHISKKIAARPDCDVYYFDADSPASEHPQMAKFANKHDINYLQITSSKKGVQGMMELLDKFVKKKADLDGKVFIFDTLKKFTNMMKKDDTKGFYDVMKKITSLGGSIVLLGHANKRKEKDGCMMYEGTADVLADTDDLMYLETVRSDDNGIDVSTVVDASKNTKFRGIIKPISFSVSKLGKRKVKRISGEALKVQSYGKGKTKVREDVVLDTAKTIIRSVSGGVINYSRLWGKVSLAFPDAGKNRLQNIIKANSSVYSSDETAELYYEKGDKNSQIYRSEYLDRPILGGDDVSAEGATGLREADRPKIS